MKRSTNQLRRSTIITAAKKNKLNFRCEKATVVFDTLLPSDDWFVRELSKYLKLWEIVRLRRLKKEFSVFLMKHLCGLFSWKMDHHFVRIW